MEPGPGIPRVGSRITLIGEGVRYYVGNFSTEMSNHINKFDIFIGTVRSADSLMSWAIESPQHIPDTWKEWALKFSTIAWAGPLALGELKNVRVNVVNLKDHLNFLELYNRAAKLTDWHNMKWQKQAALVVQIAQKMIESVFLQPAKWGWQVSRLTDFEFLPKKELSLIKDICVLISSSLGICAAITERNANNAKLQNLSLRLSGMHKSGQEVNDEENAIRDFAGLLDIRGALETAKKTPVNADVEGALNDYKNKETHVPKKGLIALCNELGRLKNSLDVLEANTNLDNKAERDHLIKQKEKYQILKHKCIRRWCWEKGLADAPLPAPLPAFVNGALPLPQYAPVTFAEFPAPPAVLGELENVRKNFTAMQRIERIVKYKINKTTSDKTNRESLCNQLKISFCFDAVKISIVAFAIIINRKWIPHYLNNYPRIQDAVQRLVKEAFWMDGLLMGSVGLVRHYAGRFEAIKPPSPHGVWN